MDVTTSNDYYHFVYDPQLYGLNTAYWQQLNGAATLTGANKIRVNSVTIATKHQYLHGDFTFRLNVAGAPTGLVRRWGLMSPAIGTIYNAMYFEQNAGVWQAVVVNDAGTATTYPMTWDSSDWNTTDIDFNIQWTRNRVTFSVSGVPVAIFDDRNLTPGYVTLPLFITNNEADSLDVVYLIGKHIEKVVQPLWELPVASATSTVTTGNIESAKETVTVTENFTVSPQATITPGPNVNDTVTTSENLTVIRQPVTWAVNVSDTATTTEHIG
jgi:hypothetical protein